MNSNQSVPGLPADPSLPRLYKVEGMSCGHCKAAIEEELRALESVSHAEVDLETGMLEVQGSASESVVREAVAEAGYQVVI